MFAVKTQRTEFRDDWDDLPYNKPLGVIYGANNSDFCPVVLDILRSIVSVPNDCRTRFEQCGLDWWLRRAYHMCVAVFLILGHG